MTSVAFHVDQAFYRIPGGIGTYLRELVPALAGADPSLRITMFHARFDVPAQGWMQTFPTVALPHRIRTLYPGWAVVGRPRLPRELSTLDVVHTPSPVAIPPPGHSQDLVVTVHDLAFRVYPRAFPAPWSALFRLGLRRAARRAAAIITPSAHTAGDLQRLTGASSARVHVIPLAASLPTAEKSPEEVLRRLRVPPPYVLNVGTIEPRKNLVRLVRAYRRAVAGSELPHALVLAGPLGWGSEPLHRELAASGPGRIVPTGSVAPEDLDALYRGADAFAYPSLYEGFGLPVLEAMVRGIPTIVSTSSSLPEVAGDAAVAVDPRSVHELTSAIERILTDRPEAERLAAAGRDRAKLFSWERTARETLEVYRAVTAGR